MHLSIPRTFESSFTRETRSRGVIRDEIVSRIFHDTYLPQWTSRHDDCKENWGFFTHNKKRKNLKFEFCRPSCIAQAQKVWRSASRRFVYICDRCARVLVLQVLWGGGVVILYTDHLLAPTLLLTKLARENFSWSTAPDRLENARAYFKRSKLSRVSREKLFLLVGVL